MTTPTAMLGCDGCRGTLGALGCPTHSGSVNPAPPSIHNSQLARYSRIEMAAQAVVEEDEQLERDWGGPTSPAIVALREALRS